MQVAVLCALINVATINALDINNETDVACYCSEEKRIKRAQKYFIHSAEKSILAKSERAIIQDSDKERMMRLFYAFDFDGVISASIGNKSIYYMRIFKNGNDEIRTLLNLVSDNKTEIIPFNAFPQHYEATLGGRENKPAMFFSFYRDPMTRFISAYTEIMLRKSFWNREHGKGYSPLPVKDFIELLLHWRCDHMREMNHCWSQVGPRIVANRLRTFLTFNFHSYRLEDFNASIAELAKAMDIPQLYSTYRDRGFRRLSSHFSSNDPMGTSRAAKEFLANSPLYTLAVCRIYFSDYLCSPPPGYKFPVACNKYFLSEKEQRSIRKL